MDLAAFLQPGADWPVSAAETDGRNLDGRLAERRGRPLWLFSQAGTPGRMLNLSLTVPGFSLDRDGSLQTASPETEARLLILAQVRGCRYFPPHGLYVWRLKLLGRIWPLEAGPVF
ncbi:MAG: hypothetical protein LBP33_10960 [Candidatus Adiutrix sp.]|jgi:hypothetical protein|nr:hypothetical protein [Candidatus Adiutrix sp.]